MEGRRDLHHGAVEGVGDRGQGRHGKQYRDIMLQVRAFYLDIQEWATGDPSWAPWAVPSPVRKGDTDGMMKVKKQTSAEMHQRVRERLPHLPVLVETAERNLVAQDALLTAAKQVGVGHLFVHDGRQFRRTQPQSYSRPQRGNAKPKKAVWIEDQDSREIVDVTRAEDDAFWSWAVIETLRHTGVRVEELLEITHLGLVSYKLPDTGEVVPMLQIVPSKTNEERLLLVGPELASVLATIIRRLRTHNDGTIPLTTRYDAYERTAGPPLPHLFQRRLGWQWKVPSHSTILGLVDRIITLTGLQDAAGQPLRCTPHDFRRMFATEAVTGGLPVHIVARLLGHKNINTTQAYMNYRELHQTGEKLQVAC